MEKPGAFRRGMLKSAVVNAREFPWRREHDRFAVLIGELLLQRTRGEHVEAVYRDFMKRWPTPARLARARVPSVERVVVQLGLRKRAAVLVEIGRRLDQMGHVPSDPDELLLLPGVGPYVANSVAVFAEGRNLPLVDWVIARVLRRYFGLPGQRRPNSDRELWEFAAGLAGPGRARELWLGTLDFAAAVCKPRPHCAECPLRKSCSSSEGFLSSVQGRIA